MQSQQSGFFDEQSEASQVKATIVAKYFGAWTRVMLSQGHVREVVYIDLFAGPGRYKSGKKSTPLLVLEQAIANPQLRASLVAIFNDSDPNCVANLTSEINALPGTDSLKHKPKVTNSIVGEEIARLFEQTKLAPTLFFVDPWGYKGLSLRLVNSVLKDWGCDCIFFFNYNRINMGVTNEIVREHLNALFGEDRAERLRQRVASLSPDQRELAIVNELAQALQDLGGRYVLPFRFVGKDGKRTSHYLVFISKGRLGYDIMKEIMARESSDRDDGVASFEYTPVKDKQLSILFGYARPLDELGGELLGIYAGREMTVKEIFDAHNVGTPFILPNYKEALRRLEAEGLILTDPPKEKRRKNTLADHVKVIFPKQRGHHGP